MNILLVVVCVFTRFVFLRPLLDKSAHSVASAFFSSFDDFGFPKFIQLDNLMQAMTINCGIDHRLITKYHFRTNGVAERNVRTSIRAIKKLLEGDNQEWDRFVSAVQLFMNLKIADAHQSFPFSVMFTRSANNFEDLPTAKRTNRNIRGHPISIVFQAIRDVHRSHAATAIAWYARRHRILKDDSFPPGTLVIIRDPDRSDKLQRAKTAVALSSSQSIIVSCSE
jgi:hypothetical protein